MRTRTRTRTGPSKFRDWQTWSNLSQNTSRTKLMDLKSNPPLLTNQQNISGKKYNFNVKCINSIRRQFLNHIVEYLSKFNQSSTKPKFAVNNCRNENLCKIIKMQIFLKLEIMTPDQIQQRKTFEGPEHACFQVQSKLITYSHKLAAQKLISCITAGISYVLPHCISQSCDK